MASFKKTYDTDSIVLRRIFAVNPDTNGRISANTFLVTGANGLGSFQDAVSFLSTISVPTSIVGGSGVSVTNTNGVYTIATSSIGVSDLTSTTIGLGQIYNSTILVAGTNITFSSNANQLIINGQAGGGGGLAASDLTSTTMGLGSLGYISTPQLTSSLRGLGSLGYLSTTQLASTIANLGQIYNSTILVAGTNITFSSNANQLIINGQAGGGGGLAASDLTSTTKGLGLLGYISTPQLISSLQGLGTLGYVSTAQLASTIANLGQIYNSTILVAGTNITFSSNANQLIINGQAGGGGGLAASDLTSTTMGLGSLGYISTPQLTSSLRGLGSLGYLSTTQLASTIANLGQIYNSTILVAGTNITFSSNANQITINGQAGGGGGLAASDLTSTTKGLGSLGYLSSLSAFNSGTVYYLNWSQAGPTYPYKALQPTITSGSQQSDVNSIATNTDRIIQTFQTSTILPSFISAGIWDLNLFVKSDSYYVSVYYKLYKLHNGTPVQIGTNSSSIGISPADGSTTVQVVISIAVPYTTLDAGDTVYIELHGVNSDISLSHSLTIYYEANTYSHVHTTFLESVTELSTISGLGSLGYISTASLVSSVAGLGTYGYISSVGLQSTIEGLGSFRYLSSFTTISSANLSSGSLFASFLSSQRITASSITANKFVGDGSLITNVPNLGVTYITAGTGIGVNTNTGNVTVSNTGVLSITQGSGISITGGSGSFTITATGGVAGTVATADLVSTVIGLQINTTSTTMGLGLLGYISSLATISSLNISSGSLFASFLSSQKIMVSSINANKFIGDGSLLTNLPGSGLAITDLTSTVTGLGTFGYLSSAAELISSPQLTSSLVGLGTFAYISSLTLRSTIQGLGTIGYLSSSAELISSPQLTSSLIGLGTFGYLSSAAELISSPQLTSSLLGLGTFGYTSSLTLQSTIQGLGTFGYTSSLTLQSTTQGLGTFGYLSSFNTLSSLNISSGSLYTSTTSTTEITAGRVNFGTLYVNNAPIIFDQYGNLQLSFQTL